ncbi:MAG: hypothetical protein RJB52_958 [Pseudomonadota bacterium]
MADGWRSCGASCVDEHGLEVLRGLQDFVSALEQFVQTGVHPVSK